MERHRRHPRQVTVPPRAPGGFRAYRRPPPLPCEGPAAALDWLRHEMQVPDPGRVLRLRAGLSAAEVAARVGAGERDVRVWEESSRRVPRGDGAGRWLALMVTLAAGQP